MRILLILLLVTMQTVTTCYAGKKYALVIGVKTYRAGQPLPELSYTENDATDLAAILTKGSYDVTLMTQTVARTPGKELMSPTSDYIRDQMLAILDNPFLKEDDIVIIALAGHGVQFEKEENSQKKPQFYFCPADADIQKLTKAEEVTERNNLVNLQELYSALQKCKAGGKLLLVDACRNDPTKPKLQRSLASVSLPPIPPPPGGTAVFFSCSAHEQALEDPDLKHGVFFHHVIEALSGDADSSTTKRPADGEITLSELAEYVSGSTYDFVRKKHNGARQAPELKGEFRVSIPLILASRDKPVMPTPTSIPSSATLKPAEVPAVYKVKFETTVGDFVIEVQRGLAPNGADRMHELVTKGFYDECRFFRVMPGFMVQFGINGDPEVDKKWREANIEDDPVRMTNSKGTITFASAGPGTRTSQLFINYADNKYLDSQGFSPFGKVVEGLDVVEKINSQYGEKPDQNSIQTIGNTYLNKTFPKLDYIKKASIVKNESIK